MPVIGLWFRQAAWARGGHLGGNCRERQPRPWRITVPGYRPVSLQTPMRLFDLSGNAIVMARRARHGSAFPRPLIPRMARPPHQRRYLFRLSAPAAPTHNRSNNEDGLQCARSLVAGWRVKMSEKIYDVPADWAKRAWVDQAKFQQMY